MTPEEYFKKWSENCRIFQNYKPIHDHNDMMQFAKDYHSQQLLIHDVGRSTCNIEIAIKHFEKRKKDFGSKLSNEEVMKVLHFLKQANEQALDLIGIGYTRYDGGNDKEIGVKNMYEGGFIVKK